MNPDWIDISVPLRPGMVCWPGDAPFERRDALTLATGGECNLSELSLTAHTGTHIDAPRHYLTGGAGIDAMPINATVGRARVIAIQDPELIRISEIEASHLAKGDRVLFKTQNSARCWKTGHFESDYIYIPPDTARFLAACGVQTVGIDYLSVGGTGPQGAETHRILLSAGVWIIESLNLEHVEPGEYELVCLPLKILGSDGAPARAVLRKLVL
ncbi:MAG TPA: cyclase family protein [Bryobacteraceae bacterium]|nr:cyclase family protein [Bryobacteraceae bacterium]